LLVLLLLGGLFGHNLYRYTWLWALGFLGVLRANSAPHPVDSFVDEPLTDETQKHGWDWAT
jgi:hypothetical protein